MGSKVEREREREREKENTNLKNIHEKSHFSTLNVYKNNVQTMHEFAYFISKFWALYEKDITTTISFLDSSY